MTTEYRHIPVMLAEVTQQLSLKPGSIVVDCTLGGAGHSSHLADLVAPGGTLVGIDRDIAALHAASHTLRLGQQLNDTEIILRQGGFGELDEILVSTGIPYADAIFFDLGVSSHQIDAAERGFSFKADAPLDMRMDQSGSLTAAEILSSYSHGDLTRIFTSYGEERWASRIAQFIVRERERQPILTSEQLVEVVKAAVPASARRSGGHPAKRVFQALRIEVNRELDHVERGIDAAIRWLSPGGKVAVLTYHSLEDRIVKRAFRDAAQGCTCPPGLPVCRCGNQPVLKDLTRRALLPSDEEVEVNPRARSAKLRVGERLAET